VRRLSVGASGARSGPRSRGSRLGVGFGRGLRVFRCVGRIDILPGALEITTPDVTVASANPTVIASAGGTTVTLTGTNFADGATIVIGDRFYRSSTSDADVVDANTITLQAAATTPGTYDVVVINPSGIEGRVPNAVSFVGNPSITSVFPAVGDVAGGTQVTLVGTGFAGNATVTLGGTPQPGVSVTDGTSLTFTTTAGTAGSQTLVVSNGPGFTASTSFTYVAMADPTITAITPDSGGGGTMVTITGSGFDANTEVLFGVDALTGQGGLLATNVTVVSATRIECTTPGGAAGLTTVMVRDSSTGQSDVLVGAFTTVGGGGGGGCHAGPAALAWREGWWALLALLGIGLWSRRRLRTV